MNLNKSYDFFKPESCNDMLNIIGCGAIGSTVAENLVRLGLTRFTLYDFDTVDPHNVANQMYRNSDIGKLKVEALKEMLIEINPDVKDNIRISKNAYATQPLSGYVFLCIDSIDTRRKIAEQHTGNMYIKAMFDFRMRLTDAQHYAADWKDKSSIENLIKSMKFTHQEALDETPVSACNLPLSVVPTVRTICALGVANFMNFVKQSELKKLIVVDAFSFNIDAF